MAKRLSQRQRECLSLVGRGMTSKEIGRILSLSPSTVDNHLNIATEKLGCTSRSIAARILEIAAGYEPDQDAGAGSDIERLSGLYHHAGTSASDQIQNSFLLPPLGGATNQETITRRIRNIGLVAIAATMGFTAITITIAGIVQLLGR